MRYPRVEILRSLFDYRELDYGCGKESEWLKSYKNFKKGGLGISSKAISKEEMKIDTSKLKRFLDI